MRDCTVDSDDGTGDFSLVLGVLQVYGQAHVGSHVPPGMDCNHALGGNVFPFHTFYIVLIHCIGLSDPAISECQFTHPVDATTSRG